MPSTKTLVVSLLCLTAFSSQSATQAPQRVVVLYEGARLITGDGTPPIEDSAFIVENDKFVRVGRKGEVQRPSGATRVNLAGKTVIPGLIDTHAHIGYMKDVTNGPENYSRENILDHMRRYAYFGVAAAMSMGSDFGEEPYQIRDSATPNAARFVMAGRGLTYVGTGTPENTRQNAYQLSTDQEPGQRFANLPRARSRSQRHGFHRFLRRSTPPFSTKRTKTRCMSGRMSLPCLRSRPRCAPASTVSRTYPPISTMNCWRC